jgi:hypothetical protein
MLLAMYVTPAANLIATAQFLASISASCRAQKAASADLACALEPSPLSQSSWEDRL